jgi:hypothetical protein
LEDLVLAREHFLDVRGLIELVYATEQELATLISEKTSGVETDRDGHVVVTLADIQSGAHLQQKNIKRSERLAGLITDAMAESVDVDFEPTDPAAAQVGDQKRAFFNRAHELLRGAKDAMHSTSEVFSDIEITEPNHAMPMEPLRIARLSVDTALDHLEQLRRMFFNVVEHLRETASRQQVLGDDTETAAALSDPKIQNDEVAKAGPLHYRQTQLAERTNDISAALREQGDNQTPRADSGSPRLDPESMLEASELVSGAGESMARAAEQLDETHAFDGARKFQKDALLALTEAIELLQEKQDEPQSGGDQSQSEQGAAMSEEKQEATQGPQEIAKLLQGVRDREARRRGERSRNRASAAYEPVGKDW